MDVVLNSLAEEKLRASIRCLAPGGKFMEIGKFDLANNNNIGSKTFSNGRSYHGVMLDAFFVQAPAVKLAVGTLIENGLKSGAVKPLTRVTFHKEDVEQAFRYMASGKHTGKVIINMRAEEPERTILPARKIFDGVPR